LEQLGDILNSERAGAGTPGKRKQVRGGRGGVVNRYERDHLGASTGTKREPEIKNLLTLQSPLLHPLKNGKREGGEKPAEGVCSIGTCRGRAKGNESGEKGVVLLVKEERRALEPQFPTEHSGPGGVVKTLSRGNIKGGRGKERGGL